MEQQPTESVTGGASTLSPMHEDANQNCHPTTATAAAPVAAPGPHVEWASRIKGQHYHLQQMMNAASTNTNDNRNSSNDGREGMGGDCGDLARWQAAIAAPGEDYRLRAYARAMHHLATKYWEAPMPPLPSDNSHRDDDGDENDDDDGDVVGEKRPRCPDGGGVVLSSPSGIPAEVMQRRLYNDRVQCSLDCVSSFFLGQPSTATTTTTSGGGCGGSGSAVPPAKVGRKEEAERGNETGMTPPPPSTPAPYLPLYDVYPLIVSRALKPLRRQFYSDHGRMATAAELDGMLADMAAEGGGEGTCWGKAMTYARLVMDNAREKRGDQQQQQQPPPPFFALDVGSCHGPFFNRPLWVPVLGDVEVRVTAMDLCPYEPAPEGEAPEDANGHGHHNSSTEESNIANHSNVSSAAVSAGESDDADGDVATTNCRVLQGDWVSVKFFPAHSTTDSDTKEEGCTTSTATTINTTAGGRVRLNPSTGSGGSSGGEGPSQVQSIAVSSYDVVFFCLLLSYLPSPRLRYRACLHACLALRPGGLLVIVSTRTQGPRRSRWEEQWSRCLATMGLAVVHKSTQKKIVVLSLEKTIHRNNINGSGDSTNTDQQRQQQAPPDLSTEAAIDAWIERMMATPAAADGLQITADAHI